MASRLDGSALLTWLAATALAAACWWFGTGVHTLWWFTWLAPLPVLWLAPRVRGPMAALAAFAAYAIGGFNQWDYLHHYIGLPLPFIAYAIAMPGVALAVCVLLFRRLLVRGRGVWAALAVPTAWVAIEYVSSLLSPHGTFGSIGYTQMDALPILQVAAVAGLWGISFLVLLVPTSIAVLLSRQVAKRDRLIVAVSTTIVLAASLAYGGWRLQAPAVSTMRIGLVSLEKPIRPALAEADGQALQARYVDALNRLADQGAHLVLIPETSFATPDAGVPALAQVATQRGITVATGIDFKGDAQAERNMLTVLQPAATSPATYSKHHLIPGLERQYTPGDSYTMLAGEPRIGLAVCKDMDFHDIGHAYAARQTQLLLVPAWDFSIDGWLHGRMAIMRGVESGFAVARAPRSGRLTLSDDRGRVVAEASSEQHDAELVGNLPLRETHTLYSRWGDWFVWLNLLGLIACLAFALRPPVTQR
jgi:apolipoprotein N-acyltransferase